MTKATGSSELVERLREAGELGRSLGLNLLETLFDEVADRIADLAARLALAEEALRKCASALWARRLIRTSAFGAAPHKTIDARVFIQRGRTPAPTFRRTTMLENSVLTIHDHNAKLTLDQLAEALYEGMPHLQNLAEKLARQHGSASALSFYGMMGEDVQNFWRGIAKQLIDHAAEWQSNKGSGCVLSERERARLKALPRVENDRG